MLLSDRERRIVFLSRERLRSKWRQILGDATVLLSPEKTPESELFRERQTLGEPETVGEWTGPIEPDRIRTDDDFITGASSLVFTTLLCRVELFSSTFLMEYILGWYI